MRYGVVPYSSTVNVGRLLYADDPANLRANVTVPSRVSNMTKPVYTANTPTTSADWEVYNGTRTETQCQSYVGANDVTSNLGAQNMKAGSKLGFDRVSAGQSEAKEDERKKQIKSDVMVEVERHFRPEFLNRLDELVIFNPLTHADLQKIVHLQLAEVQERLEDKGIVLALDDAAIDFLITKGFHEDYGARPLRRAIERHIEDPLAEGVLRGDFEKSKTVKVTVAEDNEGFSFAQEAKPEPEPEPEPETEPATAGDEG